MIMQPWQIDMLDKLCSTGVKPGELMTIASGRNVGKSSLSAQALARLMYDLNNNPITDLTMSEGTVYGSQYYCVEPVGGNWREMEDWCIQLFGESTGSIWAEQFVKQNIKSGERWYGNNRKFWFRDEQDRMMFVLKWR